MTQVALRPLPPPVAGVCRNPMRGLQSSDMVRVGVGVPLRDLVPPHTGPLFCVYNGRPLSPLTVAQREHVNAVEELAGFDAGLEQLRQYRPAAENWQLTRTQPGDVIEWYEQPGREAVRTLLTIITVAVAIFAPEFLPGLIALSTAYNLLLPPKQAHVKEGDAAKTIYSAALTGNEARLDQPIWKVCGRVQYTPPFAAQPYLEYLPNPDAESPILDWQQYFYAVFAVSLDAVEIEKALIGKTSASHYADVVRADLLAPGELPTTVLANVTTSEDIASGAELEHKHDGDGIYVGGFAACRPRDKALAIGIDVEAGQGLGKDVDTEVTCDWQVEVRDINDFGAPIGEWQIIANESRKANTNTRQRWSYRYDLVTPMRCEVRLVRTNEKDKSSSARDGIQWSGLRAYLQRQAPLNANTSHFEVVMRASEQLNGSTSTDFRLIVRGLVRKWNPDTGWSDPVFSRNPADWLADLWTSSTWGEGLPDDRVDLQGLYEWGLVCDARQDHIDLVFSQFSDAWDVAQTIARTGRARPFIKNGVRTVARDEWQDLPRSAIMPRIAQAKSMVLGTKLPKREQADGFIVEYQSNVTWDTELIECPCPGYSVSDPEDPRFDPDLPPMSQPIYKQLEGITGAKHAEREGLYEAASMALRATTVEATIEMEAVSLSYMDLVRWMPEIPGYGQSGDVAFWDASTLVMGLTEPPIFGAEPLYLTLVRDDGTLTEPVPVLPGPTAYDVTLPEAPDFELVLDDASRERPKFLLGPMLSAHELAKVAVIAPGEKTDEGAQFYQVTGVVDVEAVHLADNHLLPGPGEIQDPIDDGLDVDDDSGGGVAALVRLTRHYITAGEALAPAGRAAFTLFANGVAGDERAEYADLPAVEQQTFAREWITTAPVEPSVAALYECFATDFGSMALATAGGATCAGPLEAWTPLSADVTWSFEADPSTYSGPRAINVFDTTATVELRVQIRRIGSTVVQAEQRIALILVVGEGGGGA